MLFSSWLFQCHVVIGLDVSRDNEFLACCLVLCCVGDSVVLREECSVGARNLIHDSTEDGAGDLHGREGSDT